ncbi:hypothetical protein TI39_contig5854g00006 [Zymoseptoria brevis]|uniref:Uncharacterized protein n=1 Tax=Zymoseptoria brevis TaxID=1047168 RepID=A0A0F4G862_9PEZI|nr:hypothetical protein TI39_contig5854g00006 [Zymoseptoria brevis]
MYPTSFSHHSGRPTHAVHSHRSNQSSRSHHSNPRLHYSQPVQPAGPQQSYGTHHTEQPYNQPARSVYSVGSHHTERTHHTHRSQRSHPTERGLQDQRSHHTARAPSDGFNPPPQHVEYLQPQYYDQSHCPEPPYYPEEQPQQFQQQQPQQFQEQQAQQPQQQQRFGHDDYYRDGEYVRRGPNGVIAGVSRSNKQSRKKKKGLADRFFSHVLRNM